MSSSMSDYLRNGCAERTSVPDRAHIYKYIIKLDPCLTLFLWVGKP